MIPNYNPVTQALLGTLFTWGVTALGSALVFIFNSGQVKHFKEVVYLLTINAKVTFCVIFIEKSSRCKPGICRWGEKFVT